MKTTLADLRSVLELVSDWGKWGTFCGRNEPAAIGPI